MGGGRMRRAARAGIAVVALAFGACVGDASSGGPPATDGAGGGAAPVGAAVAAGAAREARLRVEGGRLLVRVSVDGREGQRFIIDTAAESSAVARSLAERLAPDATRLGRVRVMGVGGARLLPTLDLLSLEVADVELSGVRAVVIDDALLGDDRDGLLGNDVLRRFDVEIDVPAERIRLLPLDAAVPLRVALPMTSPRAGFVAFDATLAGRPVRAILDTGAPTSVINWQAAALAGVTPQSPGVRERRGGTTGLDGLPTVTHAHAFDRLSFGSTTFPATELLIADLPLFEVAGTAGEAAMIVGVDLLERCAVVIGYSTRTLYVCDGVD
jgi:predicted aspartyl protease